MSQNTQEIVSASPVDNMIDMILTAIEDNTLLNIRYGRVCKNGYVAYTNRAIKPSHIYTYQDGSAYVRAFCTIKGAMRTFKIQHIRKMTVGRQVEITSTVLYPAVWKARKACAYAVKSVDTVAKYLATGAWSTYPVILCQPTQEVGKDNA